MGFYLILFFMCQIGKLANGQGIRIRVVGNGIPSEIVNVINDDNVQTTVMKQDNMVVTRMMIRHKGNLKISGDSQGNSPIQIIGNIDRMMDEFFLNMIDDMMRRGGFVRAPQIIESNRQKDQEQEEKIEDIDVSLNDSEDNNNTSKNDTGEANKMEDVNNSNNYKNNNITHKENENQENTKSEQNNNNNITDINKKNITSKHQVKPRKTTLYKDTNYKKVIFSKLCKYVFYSIILFAFYILFRKLFELLDIIDKPSTPSSEETSNDTAKDEKTIVEMKKDEKVLDKTKIK